MHFSFEKNKDNVKLAFAPLVIRGRQGKDGLIFTQFRCKSLDRTLKEQSAALKSWKKFSFKQLIRHNNNNACMHGCW